MDIISTRQVAELLAVSEATIKRWADAGTLRCYRTVGGHRKFRMNDVADFLRDHQYESTGAVEPSASADPDHPAVDPAPTLSEPTTDPEAIVRFRNLTLAADVDNLVSSFAQYRLQGFTLASIFDRIVMPAMADIGERWARGVLTVSQEHVAASALIEALARTRPLIERPPSRRGKIVFVCPGQELHDVAARMASLIAHGLGYQSIFVGARSPSADAALLIVGERPRLVAVSASAAIDPAALDVDLGRIAEASESVSAMVIAGGLGFRKLASLPTNVRWLPAMTELHGALSQ